VRGLGDIDLQNVLMTRKLSGKCFFFNLMMCSFFSCIFPADMLLGDNTVTSATGVTVETLAQSTIE